MITILIWHFDLKSSTNLVPVKESVLFGNAGHYICSKFLEFLGIGKITKDTQETKVWTKVYSDISPTKDCFLRMYASHENHD